MKKSATTLIWGLILIGIGFGFLWDNLGMINFNQYLSNYWPIVLVLVGVGEFLSGNRTSAFVWIIVGSVFQLSVLDLITGSVLGTLVSILLIWIGISMLRRTSSRSSAGKVSQDYVSATSIFGGNKKKVDAKEFRGASVNAVFHGTTLDLRNAKLAQDGAVIDILVLFGGVEILVPKNLGVRIDALALFGSGEDERGEAAAESDKPQLTIRGLVLFGGLDIKD